MKLTNFPLAVSLLGMLAAVACEGAALTPTPTSTPVPTATPLSTPTPTSAPESTNSLTESHIFPGINFSIDYHSGWYVGTLGRLTAINELEEDNNRALLENFHVSGYSVFHSHFSPYEVSSLTPNPSLGDLLTLNAELYGWSQPVQASETTVFGVPALRVTTPDKFGNWEDSLFGFLGDEAFLLTMTAPTEAELDEIKPIWNDMLKSIRPAKPTAPDSGDWSIDVARGRIGWWPGEGDANDVVSGNHGTLGGGVAFAPGFVGQAFGFDGIDDFLVIPDSLGLRPLDDQFSVVLWINPLPRTGNPDVTIIRNGKGCGEPGWGLDFLDYSTGNSHLYFTAWDGIEHSWAILSPHIFADSWYFVVATVDGQHARIYLNGELSEERPIRDREIDTPDPISVGANKANCEEYHNFFSGLIDEVMIYNRALNPAEIQALFEVGGESGGTPTLPDITVKIDELRGSCSGVEQCVFEVDLTISEVNGIAAPSFDVRADLENGEFGGVLELGLEAGESVQRTARTGAGDRCYDPSCDVTASVDVSDAVIELDETNNTDQTSLWDLPDLAIQFNGITESCSGDPVSCVYGVDLLIFELNGVAPPAPVSGIFARVHLLDNNTSVTFLLPPIEAFEVLPLNVQVGPGGVCPISICEVAVTVDLFDGVIESDETNKTDTRF